MRKFYATATLWATLAVIGPSVFEPSFAGAADAPEKTVPQGQDPPGADNGKQRPLSPDKEVIPPPPAGDEDFTRMHLTQMPDMRRKSSLHLRQRMRRASRPTKSPRSSRSRDARANGIGGTKLATISSVRSRRQLKLEDTDTAGQPHPCTSYDMAARNRAPSRCGRILAAGRLSRQARQAELTKIHRDEDPGHD